jgi:hypothetical protein
MARRLRPYIRFMAGMALGLLLVAVIAFNALLLWVATGPRSLNNFTPYIESALGSASTQYKVDIGETWLLWDGWKHPIDIRLRKVTVLTKDEQVFSHFPEIAVGVHIPSLFVGRVLPTSLGISHPVISLLQNADGSISFGFKKSETEENTAPTTIPFAAVLQPLLSTDRSNNLRKLNRVVIQDADVSVGNAQSGIFFEAREVEITAKRNRKGVIEFITAAKVRYGDYQSPISARMIMDRQKQSIDGSVEFSGVEVSTLATLFLKYEALAGIAMPISGNLVVSTDMEGTLKQLLFNVDGGIGTIESPHLAAPMHFNWAHAEGIVSNNAQDIEFTKLAAQIDGMPFGASGKVNLQDDDMAIVGEARIKDVTVDKLPMLWLPELAPMTREWVTSNISDGRVPEANVKVNIQHGDLKKPLLPKEAIDANIHLEGGKIRYVSEHPEVHNVKGLIHVDGMALDAAVESATYLKDTKISNARVLIEDLNPDNPYLKVNLDVETSARDAVHFMGLPRLKHAERLNMKENEIEGAVKGSAALGFYFFEPKDANGKTLPDGDIAFDIKAAVSNISQNGFMGKFDARNVTGSVTINNKSLEFTGTGNINGANASKMQVGYLFEPDKAGLDTFIDVTAAAPVESLTRFGYPKLDFLKGTFGVAAKVKQGADTEFSEASINLTDTTIAADFMGWSKPDKEPATLDLAVEKKDGKITITSFALKGNGLDAAGSAMINKEMSDIAGISLNRLQLGKTKLNKLNYAAIEGGFIVEVEGGSLDLSGYMASRAQQKETNFSFEHFPSLELNANIDRVLVAAGQEISGFKGEVSCGRICNNANIKGSIGDKPFDFRIMKNPKGKRQLSLHAQNAGAFLKAIDMYGNMEGGDLSITGNYDDSPTDSILHARLDITDHVIKKAPVLTKILSLASLTGFIDTLQGNGIRFNKMAATFTLANDVIRFEKAKAYGPAIGLTAEGTITMPKAVCDLNGTVVPSYTLNSVVGKVPIIGQILTGGEGKGVFAANYTVKDTLDDPKVSVNPLSILTPGFLREIFE